MIVAFSPGKQILPGRRAAHAAPLLPGSDDRAVFVIAVAGRTIGTESYAIQSSREKVEAQAQIELRIEKDGKVFEFKTFPKLILNSQLLPLTYHWSQKGSQASHLEVDFRASPAKSKYRTVSGEEDRRDFELPRDVLVVDVNVIHHYQLVVSRYNSTAGGAQTFQAFIPQEALPGILSVEALGLDTVEIQGRSEPLRHLVVSTDLTRIDLWVDAQQRLQRVLIPAAQLEAWRMK